jgi:DUF971 family protein
MADEVFPDESLTQQQCRPTGLDLDLRAQVLRITWADGVGSGLPLSFLRRHCPCATCRTERQKRSGALLPILSASQSHSDGGTATGGHLVGNYAMQIDWADGHATGIYDFRFLRTLDRVHTASHAG